MGEGVGEGSRDISIVQPEQRCRWWAWPTPGHVKAHVGWRTHGGGHTPARRIKLVCPVLLLHCMYACTHVYVQSRYSGKRYVHIWLKKSEGSKRETRRDGKRETRNAIRQCSRAKPAEGRGMTEPGTWVHPPRPLEPQLAGGGAQGRYDGRYMVYIGTWALSMSPAPCPLPLLPPCPPAPISQRVGTSAPCTAQDGGSSQQEGILGQGRRRKGFLHQVRTLGTYINRLVSRRAGLRFEVVTKQDTASSAGRRLMHGT
jgi:hypothetical protein